MIKINDLDNHIFPVLINLLINYSNHIGSKATVHSNDTAGQDGELHRCTVVLLDFSPLTKAQLFNFWGMRNFTVINL